MQTSHEHGEGAYALEQRKGQGRRADELYWPGKARGRHWVRKSERRAKMLGWLGIGLGLAEIAVRRGLAEAIGLKPNRRAQKTLVRLGAREIVTGVGILVTRRPAPFLWARVLGDIVDIALLTRSEPLKKRDAKRVTAATAAVAGITLLDVWTALELSQRRHRGLSISAAVTVNRSPEEVYRFWRDFENLPRFMRHVESVRVKDHRSFWRAKALGGPTLEWEAELVIDRPNEMIAWRSYEGSKLPNAGSVRFRPAPGGRGTEVIVKLEFDPPGGAVGAAFARLFGKVPQLQIEQDLRRFKQVLEVGEVVHSDSSIHRGPHPARPSGRMERFERQAAQ